MAKKKIVTSSMAVALAMCTTTGSFATEPVVTDANIKTEQVTTKDSDKEKPTEKPDVEFGKGMIDKGEYYDNTNICECVY